MAFGFQAINADGSLGADYNERFTRLVHIEAVAYNFTGTFSVADFDDTKGIFIMFPKCVKLTTTTYPVSRTTDDHSEATSAWLTVPTALPGLAWNNTTKVMTVTASTEPFHNPDWNIVFIHYK